MWLTAWRSSPGGRLRLVLRPRLGVTLFHLLQMLVPGHTLGLIHRHLRRYPRHEWRGRLWGAGRRLRHPLMALSHVPRADAWYLKALRRGRSERSVGAAPSPRDPRGGADGKRRRCSASIVSTSVLSTAARVLATLPAALMPPHASARTRAAAMLE